MSFCRTALRLAAEAALTGNATLAGARVYDTRMDPLDLVSDVEAVPLVIIYTETDETTPYPGQIGSRETIANVVFEIAFSVRGGDVEVALPNGQTATVATRAEPMSDARLEAHLDTLEAGLRRALDIKLRVLASAAWRAIVGEIRKIESVPLRDSDGTTRLSARTVTYSVKVKTEAWPEGAGLPEPLATIRPLLPDGSHGAAIIDELAELVPGPVPLPPPLQQVTIYAGIERMPETEADADVRAAEPNHTEPP